jgi:hypothetical protein
MPLYVAWAVLALTIVGCALFASRSRHAYRVAVGALATLFLVAGAAVNAAFLLTDQSYSGFADGSSWSFVTSTWESLVVPNEGFFISLLVAFEATVGVLVLLGGRPREVGLWLIAAFHVALLSFSWWFLLWSGAMVLAMVLLLRSPFAHDPWPRRRGGSRHRAEPAGRVLQE